ncbi:MAG TPA: LysR family transcriptional regulator [Solirubrobacteraceae bacterium]
MSFRPGHLTYFVAVAEEGQLTRAASRLGVAQPALSKAVAQLEADLGLTLFERHPRGVTLTPAGEQFYEKARLAVAADAEAEAMAESLARSISGTLRLGYLGIPPALHTPDLFDAFAERYPEVELSLHDLPFPSLPTSAWLAAVDLALCHTPCADTGVWMRRLRAEPRVVLAPRSHPLAGRSEATVAELLDETFLGTDPAVEPSWAGFWSLDDHRGAPAPHTAGRSTDAQERFAMISEGRAITTMPACYAEVVRRIIANVATVPVVDATPAVFTLLGREDHRNGLVDAFIAVAAEFSDEEPARDSLSAGV